MAQYFSDVHETALTQLGNGKPTVGDTEETLVLREKVLQAGTAELRVQALLALAGNLVHCLRYTEAVAVLDQALAIDPENLEALKMHGIRNMVTLHEDKALADFSKLRALGFGESLAYRVGLASYYSGLFAQARKELEVTYGESDDEMKIAAIFWHTAASMKSGTKASLLEERYTEGMKVGHHVAYERSCALLSGRISEASFLTLLEEEKSDLDFSMLAYGYHLYLLAQGRPDEAGKQLGAILERDSFWIGFAFIAAWNDVHYHGKGR